MSTLQEAMNTALKAAGAPPGSELVFVCYNRCLYCGRITTHEVCHAHGAGYWKKLFPFKRVGDSLIGLVHVRGRTPMRLQERKRESRRKWDRRWQRAQAALWRRHANRKPETCTDVSCPQAQVDWR
jgi:hypothetical protein